MALRNVKIGDVLYVVLFHEYNYNVDILKLTIKDINTSDFIRFEETPITKEGWLVDSFIDRKEAFESLRDRGDNHYTYYFKDKKDAEEFATLKFEMVLEKYAARLEPIKQQYLQAVQDYGTLESNFNRFKESCNTVQSKIV